MAYINNQDLIMENNDELLAIVKSIPLQKLLSIVSITMVSEITIEKLEDEFVTPFKSFNIERQITGENIKCFFAITQDGMSKIWAKINSEHINMFGNKNLPLYENILEYLDEVLDILDIDTIYKNELTLLNIMLKQS